VDCLACGRPQPAYVAQTKLRDLPLQAGSPEIRPGDPFSFDRAPTRLLDYVGHALGPAPAVRSLDILCGWTCAACGSRQLAVATMADDRFAALRSVPHAQSSLVLADYLQDGVGFASDPEMGGLLGDFLATTSRAIRELWRWIGRIPDPQNPVSHIGVLRRQIVEADLRRVDLVALHAALTGAIDLLAEALARRRDAPALDMCRGAASYLVLLGEEAWVRAQLAPDTVARELFCVQVRDCVQISALVADVHVARVGSPPEAWPDVGTVTPDEIERLEEDD
jgi:hypothetical protein